MYILSSFGKIPTMTIDPFSLTHYEKLESYLPFNLLEPLNFFIASAATFLALFFRYLFFAGIFDYIFYRSNLKTLTYRRLYSSKASLKQIRFELRHSFLSMLIYSVGTVFLGILWQNSYTLIYLDFDKYGWWYFCISPFLFSMAQEIYFYFLHRLLHLPVLFNMIHFVHHKYLKPTCWASFSFHPLEALLLVLGTPLISFLLPIHPVALILYFGLFTLSAYITHSGAEILPNNVLGKSLGKLLISGLHHGIHHQKAKANYGLHYRIIDQIFKTESQDFYNEFCKKIAAHKKVN